MTDHDLRDPDLAALVERIPDDVFASEARPRRRRSLVRWLRRRVRRPA